MSDPTRSTYVFHCPCGETVRAQQLTAVCATCGRELTIEKWGAAPPVVRA